MQARADTLRARSEGRRNVDGVLDRASWMQAFDVHALVVFWRDWASGRLDVGLVCQDVPALADSEEPNSVPQAAILGHESNYDSGLPLCRDANLEALPARAATGSPAASSMSTSSPPHPVPDGGMGLGVHPFDKGQTMGPTELGSTEQSVVQMQKEGSRKQAVTGDQQPTSAAETTQDKAEGKTSASGSWVSSLIATELLGSMFSRAGSTRRVSPTTAELEAHGTVSMTHVGAVDHRRAACADRTGAAAAAAVATVAEHRRVNPFLHSHFWGTSFWGSSHGLSQASRRSSMIRQPTWALSAMRRGTSMARKLAPHYPLKVQPAGEWIPLGRRARNCLRRHWLTRWYFKLCGSVRCWRIYPWVFAFSILFFANFFTLIFSVKYIAFDKAIMTSFLTMYALGLALQFFCLDVILITVRNNMGWTRRILATKRYQVLEKIVIGPIYSVVSKVIFKFNSVFGC